MEAFAGVTTFDQNVVSYLELLRLPYTGCNPRGLILARDKALSKKLLAYHRIRVPEFTVVRPGRKPVLPKRLHVSADRQVAVLRGVGRHLAGVGRREPRTARRGACSFIHENLGTAAIVEQFIDGRELYVGVIGNERLDVLPGVGDVVRQDAGQPLADRHRARQVEHAVSEEARHHDRRGARSMPAPAERIQRIAKRAYRALDLNGYARIDLRMDEEGHRSCSRPTPTRTWPTARISPSRRRSMASPTSAARAHHHAGPALGPGADG